MSASDALASGALPVATATHVRACLFGVAVSSSQSYDDQVQLPVRLRIGTVTSGGAHLDREAETGRLLLDLARLAAQVLHVKLLHGTRRVARGHGQRRRVGLDAAAVGRPAVGSLEPSRLQHATTRASTNLERALIRGGRALRCTVGYDLKAAKAEILWNVDHLCGDKTLPSTHFSYVCPEHVLVNL
jgi:hypothetical protein